MRIELRSDTGPLKAKGETWALGPIAVITGVNGSGKTRLLQAISSNGVYDHDNELGEVLLLTTGEMQLLAFSNEHPMVLKDRVLHMRARISQTEGQPREERTRDAHDVLKQVFGVSAENIEAWEEIERTAITSFTTDQFLRHVPTQHRASSMFAGSLSARFSTYVGFMVDNDVDAVLHQYSPTKYAAPLSDDALRVRHGEAPWDGLNRALEALGLPYTFEEPDIAPFVQARFAGFEAGAGAPPPPNIYPELFNSSNEAIQLGDLSFGERTMLALAVCLYSTQTDLPLPPMPNTIALDEVDSGLHPSMVRTLMRFIQEELVTRLGMRVVLATHSPTTVALSPPDSIWEVSPLSEEQLRKVSQDEALSALLVGVPALSVRSENRRVVVVESLHDAGWYQDIFTILARPIGSELSLVFLSAGGSKSTGPEGCARVLSLVEELRGAGNLAIWGLIDRDHRTSAPPHIHFNPERYSIENFVLDPLTLAIFLLRAHAHQSPLPSLNATDVDVASGQQSQQAIDVVCQMLAEPNEDLADTRRVTYSDGRQALIPAFWTETQGHTLESRIRTRWPVLNTHNQRLLSAVISSVWQTYPGVIPASVVHCMKQLLS